MIYVKRGEVVSAYIKEGFRRLYSASIDSNGQYVDFDEMHAKSPVDSKGRKLIPFDDVFCFYHIQKDIINEVLNEPYCYIGTNSKTEHKLKEFQKHSVSFELNLGPSPNSSIESFLKKNPHLKSLFTEDEIARGKKF